MGVRTLRRPGEGTEFERVRDAVPDDPLRSDQLAGDGADRPADGDRARSPSAAQPVIVCLDHGRLMGVGAGELTKLDHAINAALLLVHVALRTGDRAGLLAFDDRVTVALSPRAGRGQMRAVLDAHPAAPRRADRGRLRRGVLATSAAGSGGGPCSRSSPTSSTPTRGRRCSASAPGCARRHLPLVITVRDPALDDAARVRPAERGGRLRARGRRRPARRPRGLAADPAPQRRRHPRRRRPNPQPPAGEPIPGAEAPGAAVTIGGGATATATGFGSSTTSVLAILSQSCWRSLSQSSMKAEVPASAGSSPAAAASPVSWRARRSAGPRRSTPRTGPGAPGPARRARGPGAPAGGRRRCSPSPGSR